MIIEGGYFILGVQKFVVDVDFQLSEIFKFGLDKLLVFEGSIMDEIDLEFILGEIKDGQWVFDVLFVVEGGSRD